MSSANVFCHFAFDDGEWMVTGLMLFISSLAVGNIG
jgi:hypothetical protein